MFFTIQREILGNEIILPNGESDGREVIGYEDVDIDADEYLALYQDFIGDYTVTMDDILEGCYMKDEFEEELKERMAR